MQIFADLTSNVALTLTYPFNAQRPKMVRLILKIVKNLLMQDF